MNRFLTAVFLLSIMVRPLAVGAEVPSVEQLVGQIRLVEGAKDGLAQYTANFTYKTIHHDPEGVLLNSTDVLGTVEKVDGRLVAEFEHKTYNHSGVIQSKAVQSEVDGESCVLRSSELMMPDGTIRPRVIRLEEMSQEYRETSYYVDTGLAFHLGSCRLFPVMDPGKNSIADFFDQISQNTDARFEVSEGVAGPLLTFLVMNKRHIEVEFTEHPAHGMLPSRVTSFVGEGQTVWSTELTYQEGLEFPMVSKNETVHYRLEQPNLVITHTFELTSP